MVSAVWEYLTSMNVGDGVPYVGYVRIRTKREPQAVPFRHNAAYSAEII